MGTGGKSPKRRRQGDLLAEPQLFEIFLLFFRKITHFSLYLDLKFSCKTISWTTVTSCYSINGSANRRESNCA